MTYICKDVPNKRLVWISWLAQQKMFLLLDCIKLIKTEEKIKYQKDLI
ncbi:MAG: hypothetical protein ABIJ74_04750 [archaeon]